MVTTRHSFATTTIGYSTQTELAKKLDEISKNGGLVLSVKNCLPEHTDTRMYVEVYYRYNL